ncbi:MAG: ABC transporter permease, partial [Candidatus Saccharimonadales bacterium]
MKKRNSTDKATVKLSILATISLSNLTHKKLRTGLTVFGIAIGIGAVYFLLSFGIGLQRLVTEEVIGNQSIKTIDVVSSNSAIVKLDDIASQRISAIANVSETGKAYYFPGSFKISGSESDAIVYGVDAGYQNLTLLNLIEGKLLPDSDKPNGIVINKAALEAIGLASNPGEVINKTLKVVVPLKSVDPSLGTLTKEFVIVGVIDSGSGSEVFIAETNFKEKGVPYLTQLKVGTKEISDIQNIRSQIESFGFETTTPSDTLEEINNVFRFLNYILVGFGGIGMIVAVLGMFNTLTISLLERTKEIGLMVALGARSIDMKRLFLFEAIFLSLFGAILGISGAFIIGRVVTVVMNVLAANRGVEDRFELFANPPLLILSMLVFMLAVGLAVVYLPAKRAERINPIDALRRE